MEMAQQRANAGMPLSKDQFDKAMKSAKLADEAQDRKRAVKAAEKAARNET
jgi:hypothetical protein